MNWTQQKTVGAGMLCALSAVGCGGGARSHTVPWDGNRTQVIGADGTVSEFAAPTGTSCLALPGGCIQPQLKCEGRAADVVLDHAGDVVETVCYPAAGTLSVDEIAAQEGNVAQNQNNAVIVFDNLADGIDVHGNLAVDANNVVIYGEDPQNAIVSGDLSVDGNGIIVRGIHIQGDVDIHANNAVFLYCTIDGNVTVTGNNAVLSACDVFGTVTVTGNNSRLTGNHIVGELKDSGKNTACSANFSAEDKNKDGTLQMSEFGPALACGKK